VIIDFEGEPARPLGERRIKRSALRDVASMLRSYHYACHWALAATRASGITSDPAALEAWTRFWFFWTSAAFLKCYLKTAGKAPFLPASQDERQILLDGYLLEKAVYELNYELNNRPDWVPIPLRAIRVLVAPSASAAP